MPRSVLLVLRPVQRQQQTEKRRSDLLMDWIYGDYQRTLPVKYNNHLLRSHPTNETKTQDSYIHRTTTDKTTINLMMEINLCVKCCPPLEIRFDDFDAHLNHFFLSQSEFCRPTYHHLWILINWESPIDLYLVILSLVVAVFLFPLLFWPPPWTDWASSSYRFYE